MADAAARRRVRRPVWYQARCTTEPDVVFIVSVTSIVQTPSGMRPPLDLCPTFQKTDNCPNGSSCSLAHVHMRDARRHIPHRRDPHWKRAADAPYPTYDAPPDATVDVSGVTGTFVEETVRLCDCLVTSLTLSDLLHQHRTAADDDDDDDDDADDDDDDADDDKDKETSHPAAVEDAGGDEDDVADDNARPADDISERPQQADEGVTLENDGDDQDVAAQKTDVALRHCSHFMLNRMCIYGVDCRFIHVAVPSKEVLDAAQQHAQRLQTRAQQRSAEQRQRKQPAVPQGAQQGHHQQAHHHHHHHHHHHVASSLSAPAAIDAGHHVPHHHQQRWAHHGGVAAPPLLSPPQQHEQSTFVMGVYHHHHHQQALPLPPGGMFSATTSTGLHHHHLSHGLVHATVPAPPLPAQLVAPLPPAAAPPLLPAQESGVSVSPLYAIPFAAAGVPPPPVNSIGAGGRGLPTMTATNAPAPYHLHHQQQQQQVAAGGLVLPHPPPPVLVPNAPPPAWNVDHQHHHLQPPLLPSTNAGGDGGSSATAAAGWTAQHQQQHRP